MSPELKTTQFPRTSTKQTTSRSGRRNRRRAIDLSDEKIRKIKADFENHPNTLDVAQNHLLPRSEAVDAILMRIVEEYRALRNELTETRRFVGIGGGEAPRPFLVSRRVA